MSNIKSGDLCLVLSTGPGDPDAGKVVTAIERVPGEELVRALGINAVITDPSPIWRVDRPMRWGSARGRQAYVPYVPERLLMPLRDPGSPLEVRRDEGVETT